MTEIAINEVQLITIIILLALPFGLFALILFSFYIRLETDDGIALL
jgi:hypothetical protein